MNCFIPGSDDKDFNNIIKDHYCNMDELNFLTKRLDSFDTREKLIFYASAAATGADSMENLINLTYNTQCYSVINDFSKLNEVGKYVYLNEAGGASTKELEELDGKAIVENLMKFSLMKAVTSYGVVYQNRIDPEIMYDGKHFPCYHWQNEVATLDLEVKGEREFLYLPSSESAIDKTLMRLEVGHLSECHVVLESDFFPKRMLELISKENQITSKMVDILIAKTVLFNGVDPSGKMGTVYYRTHSDYEGFRRLLKWSKYIHGKYWYVDENLTCPGVDYPQYIKIMKEEGYQGYMTTEYEGHRFDPTLDNEEQMARHIHMIRKLWNHTC